MAVTEWGDANIVVISVCGAVRSLNQNDSEIVLSSIESVNDITHSINAKYTCKNNGNVHRHTKETL